MSSKLYRTRIVDIAREAGVSTATVDRVLNRRPGVRETTVQRVLKIAGKMKPDALAKSKDVLQKLADTASTPDVKKQAQALLKKAGG